VAAPRRIRIELDQAGARALHAALTAALAGALVDTAEAGAARKVLEQLDRRVPDWVAADAGDDGYLAAADAILAALAEAEAGGRAALAEEELTVALAAGGASLGGVLDRMAREGLVQRIERDDRIWIGPARAGRRRQDAPTDALVASDALLDLVYAEYRPGRWAHRPSVQAIGRLDDDAFEALAGELRAGGLLAAADPDDPAALELTDRGAAQARERWAAAASLPHWRIPAPPLPYQPLPVRIEPEDRRCPAARCDGRATWLKPGRSEAWKTLLRDGAVEWACPACARTWLVYLQACEPSGAPAYRNPAGADHNRPYRRSGR
jgi:hypothetical protein